MKETPVVLLSLAKTNPNTYVEAVRRAGGYSVGGYLPDHYLLDYCDGLILGGGGDVVPSWYGQENAACNTLDEKRDQVEKCLVEQACKKQIPILGICRGMQFLNVFFGGNLIQDIGTEHSMIQGNDGFHWS